MRVNPLFTPPRPRRAGEWTPDRVVTFIVTLAATGSVTLAAREVGMSRKSAYALKARDPAFAAAWNAAVKAGKGDKADKPDTPPAPPPKVTGPPASSRRIWRRPMPGPRGLPPSVIATCSSPVSHLRRARAVRPPE